MPLNLMGCFAASNSKAEKQCASRAATARLGKTVATRDSHSLLSNKPVLLPDPDQLLGRTSENDEHWTTKAPVVTRIRVEKPFVTRAAFSGPLVHSATHDEAIDVFQTRSQPALQRTNEFVSCSDVEGGNRNRRTLRRAASFGGRPQPLPLPVADAPPIPISKQLGVSNLPLPGREDVTQAPTTSIFKLEARRGARLTGVTGGLPLPPPSLATKVLQPRLAAYEFRQLVVATDDFAAARCVVKSAAGDVFRARVEDSSGTAPFRATVDVVVLRLPENSQQGATEWKSEVHLLAQISHRNVCALKGYCAHEASSSLSPTARRRQERLMVFAQPANGSLDDHLFGNRSFLDWTTRVKIALGAARGLLYIQDLAPMQIVCKEFTASTVLLENDYTPKLAGYGLSVGEPLVHRSSSFATTMIRRQCQAKLNVRSFGVLLLELLTGKNSRDASSFGDDSNFVHWAQQSEQCMKGDDDDDEEDDDDDDDEEEEESRVVEIVDPRMKGGCPTKGAMELLSLGLRCVSKREPSLLEIVGALKSIKARHCSRKAEGMVRELQKIFKDVHMAENEDVFQKRGLPSIVEASGKSSR